MNGRFERILARYGQSVTLTIDGAEYAAKAFLQPVLSKQAHPPAAATPLGAASEQRWLYLGSAAWPLKPGDRVAGGRLRLVAQEAHPICLGDLAVCCRAVLRREKEAAE